MILSHKELANKAYALSKKYGIELEATYYDEDDVPLRSREWADVEWAAHELGHWITLGKFKSRFITDSTSSLIREMSSKKGDINEAQTCAVELLALTGYRSKMGLTIDSLADFAAQALETGKGRRWLRNRITEYMRDPAIKAMAAEVRHILHTGTIEGY